MKRTKAPDFDRLDDVDIYVQSTPLTPEEHKRLSAILKGNREKYARKLADAKSRHNIPAGKKAKV